MRGTVSRRAQNAVIVLGLSAMVGLGLPAACSAHARVQEAGARALATVGLSQPRWRLFAPNVHKENTYLVAYVELADGSSRTWSSPDWRGRTWTDRLSEGQLPKYYDNLRRDRNAAAFRSLADWVARQVAPNEAVRAVRLERRFWTIPPPEPGRPLPEPLPREQYPGRHVFYERRFP